MSADLVPVNESGMASYDRPQANWNPPCETCGTRLTSTVDRDFFGPGCHYYSLRCLQCRPTIEESR